MYILENICHCLLGAATAQKELIALISSAQLMCFSNTFQQATNIVALELVHLSDIYVYFNSTLPAVKSQRTHDGILQWSTFYEFKEKIAVQGAYSFSWLKLETTSHVQVFFAPLLCARNIFES